MTRRDNKSVQVEDTEHSDAVASAAVVPAEMPSLEMPSLEMPSTEQYEDEMTTGSMTPCGDMHWTTCLTHWLSKNHRVHLASLEETQEIYTPDIDPDGYGGWGPVGPQYDLTEHAVFWIDDAMYVFHANYPYQQPAIVTVDGHGVCEIGWEQDMVLFEDRMLSVRHPGLYWLLPDGGRIDADRMLEMWRLRIAYPPSDMSCFDKCGMPGRMERIDSVHVDVTAVLDFLKPILAERRSAVATRIQRAWRCVVYNPHTVLGKLRLQRDAECFVALLTRAP